MAYLYHAVPERMEGTILYPLNQLKDRYPVIYNQAVKKYNGREELLEDRIPILGNCLWNDVIFLTAVHPIALRSALCKGGVNLSRPINFFEIDADTLDPLLTAVYLYPELKRDKLMSYRSFHSKDVKKYQHIQPCTIRHYREQIILGRPPLMLHRVPHILHKGPIDILGLKIIRA